MEGSAERQIHNAKQYSQHAELNYVTAFSITPSQE